MTSRSILARLEKSRLLSEAELADAQSELRGSPDRSDAVFMNRLVELGRLTPWQGLQLLGGRTSFFIGPYKLLQRIGQGGAAAVYKAQHTKIGHLVALKVFPTTLLQHSDSVARFRRETQATVRVNHPHVVSGYGGKYFDGRGILIMEFVDGDDLNRWLKRCGTLPIDWCCEVARQAATGLQHIHQRGLVHRDIKPSNILAIGASTREVPQVKVADLGAANIKFGGEETARTQLTAMDGLLGTPNYMAPEQIINGHAADHRADIFGLGCTLFKLLANELPWTGATLQERLGAKMSEAPRRVTQFRNDIPPKLAAAIDNMLARHPDDRYSSADQVADELANFACRSTGAGRHQVAVVPRQAVPAPILRIAAREAETFVVQTGRRVPSEPPPLQWRLLRVSIQGETEACVLREQDTVVVGRGRECHIRIRDVQVSRLHCQLTWRGDRWQIEDLGSNNGTYVNGQPTTTCNLKNGDQIRIGSTRLWLLSMSDADAAAAAAKGAAVSRRSGPATA